MEAPLQQRIVGAIVLVTLGVIFIPALLDGSGYKARQVQDITVKEKPQFPPLQQKQLKPIATPLDANKVSQTKPVNENTSASNKPVEQNNTTKLKSFALQVGTFDSIERAETHRDTLRKAGYTTYIHKSKSKNKTVYKVRIGPELEYSVLEKIKAKIKKSHKIKAFIVNHP